MQHRPALHPYETEQRLLMQERWGRVPIGVGGSALLNVGRLTNLFALLHNPYHQLAFAGVSIPDCMLVCARMLLENNQFVQAARIFEAVERIEVRRAKTGHVEPERPQPPPPSPAPLPDAGVWVPLIPEPTREQIYFDTLPFQEQVKLEAQAIARVRKQDEAAHQPIPPGAGPGGPASWRGLGQRPNTSTLGPCPLPSSPSPTSSSP